MRCQSPFTGVDWNFHQAEYFMTVSPASLCWKMYRSPKGVTLLGVNTVGREPSWYRQNPEYHKLHASFLISCLGNCSAPPVARTEQHAWLRPGWKILPTRIVYWSNTNCAHHFRGEDNNVSFMHVQPHYYRMLQVEPWHQLGCPRQPRFFKQIYLFE